MTATEEWIYDFLETGAILRLSEYEYLVGWHLVPTSVPSGVSFFHADFFLSNQKWMKASSFKRVSRDTLLTLLQDIMEPITGLTWKGTSRSDFFSVYDSIQSAFKASLFEKVVPTVYQQVMIQLSLGQRAALLVSALQYVRQETDLLYGIWSPDSGMLGVSPEKLFSYDVSTCLLDTMAVAGTLESTEPARKLLQSAKDNHEHALVVQGIQEVLQQFGTVHVDSRQVMTIKSFHHLYTPMTCSFSVPFDFDLVLTSLHPTPALGGYPREMSFEWLQVHDGVQSRASFGAPFGVMDAHDNFHVVVSIRNVQWTQDQLSIWAGCGVVPESNFDSEWDELSLKLHSVKSLFSL